MIVVVPLMVIGNQSDAHAEHVLVGYRQRFEGIADLEQASQDWARHRRLPPSRSPRLRDRVGD